MLGRIVTNDELSNIPNFIEVIKGEDYKEDDSIITLINGFDLVMELYPNAKLNISEIQNNIFWGFTEKENRSKHEITIKNFIQKTLNFEVSYLNIDPLVTEKNLIINTFNLILNTNKTIYFHKNDFNHFYFLVDKVIYGFDNQLFKSINKDMNNFLKKISDKKVVELDEEKLFKYSDLKQYRGALDNIKLISLYDDR